MSPVSLLTAGAADVPQPGAQPGLTVRVDRSAGADWLAVLGGTRMPATAMRHETGLLHRVDRPYAFVTVAASAL